MFSGRIGETEGGHGAGEEPLSGQEEPGSQFGDAPVVMQRRHDGAVLVDGDDQRRADGAAGDERRQRLAGQAQTVFQAAVRVHAHVDQTVHQHQRQQQAGGHQIEDEQ